MRLLWAMAWNRPLEAAIVPLRIFGPPSVLLLRLAPTGLGESSFLFGLRLAPAALSQPSLFFESLLFSFFFATTFVIVHVKPGLVIVIGIDIRRRLIGIVSTHRPFGLEISIVFGLLHDGWRLWQEYGGGFVTVKFTGFGGGH